MKKAAILSSFIREDGSGVIILSYSRSVGYEFPEVRGLLQNAFLAKNGDVGPRIQVPPRGSAESYLISAREEGGAIVLSDFCGYEYKVNEEKCVAEYLRISNTY